MKFAWTAVLLGMMIGNSVLAPATQTNQVLEGEENSDWFSIMMRGFERGMKRQNKEFAASNFQILGVVLGEDQFRQVETRLGKTPGSGRGDAESGRHQVCYVSADDSEKVHLVFEQGEIGNAFYLFADGPKWRGSEQCVKSKLISMRLGTASGLRLGQTRRQVEAILGGPTTPRHKDKLFYFGGFQGQDLTVYIEVRFVNSKLNYLAVLTSDAF